MLSPLTIDVLPVIDKTLGTKTVICKESSTVWHSFWALMFTTNSPAVVAVKVQVVASILLKCSPLHVRVPLPVRVASKAKVSPMQRLVSAPASMDKGVSLMLILILSMSGQLPLVV